MRAILRFSTRLIADRKAATAVEYGLILSLIVLAIMGALIELGGTSTSMWNNVSTKVQATN